MKTDKYYCIILMTFFGMVGSILLGFIFYRESIFEFSKTNFQFISIGFIGAFLFSILEYRSLRDEIYVSIIILILSLAISFEKTPFIAYVIRNILYLGSLVLSINLYHQFIIRNSKIKYYLRSFIFVSIYTVLYVSSGIIIYLFNAKDGFPSQDFLYSLVVSAVLIGLGIGLGIDFFLQNRKQILNLLRINKFN